MYVNALLVPVGLGCIYFVVLPFVVNKDVLYKDFHVGAELPRSEE